jgi:hypothetical protein
MIDGQIWEVEAGEVAVEAEGRKLGVGDTVRADHALGYTEEQVQAVLTYLQWRTNSGFRHRFDYEGSTKASSLLSVVADLTNVFKSFLSGNPESETMPGKTEAEEGLADAVIRIFCFCDDKDFNLSSAIMERMKQISQRSL